ncbi:MAG: hypothetical protein QG614_109 [Patescibacteria group bacterium]|nr:hypothetical protein [Patescibacteria group bacterium]
MNKGLFKIFAVLFLILLTQVFSEFFLVKNNLYYLIPWIDIPMHMLGGFLFGVLFIISIDYLEQKYNKVFIKNSYKNIILLVLIIGVVWEVYEYCNYIFRDFVWGGWLDTFKDLLDDLLGAGAGYFLIKRNK